MTFFSILTGFIGRTVEVVVPNTLFEGTLTKVETTIIQVQEPSPIYGVLQFVNIPTNSIDYVRILA
ncbi:hypothetical protein D2Q93_15085 [Alicyclobacillaceae bacterium I2511]|nr:hypothetical protein D2Q93_15085 [Alicyclobacillaceae bacterium I2511]